MSNIEDYTHRLSKPARSEIRADFRHAATAPDNLLTSLIDGHYCLDAPEVMPAGSIHGEFLCYEDHSTIPVYAIYQSVVLRP